MKLGSQFGLDSLLYFPMEEVFGSTLSPISRNLSLSLYNE
jgi:hypothetical protein